ncbi:Hypothetical protein AA314_07864 [Archangium gephyra]|uniref:Uncharacterized protein n=1 Tax=Archangium gephyra TaxID=48 RepID=A0AAC8THL7_9BACT|nr:Hypothetical protein AA314_07864 [Archangium gephyra]
MHELFPPSGKVCGGTTSVAPSRPGHPSPSWQTGRLLL